VESVGCNPGKVYGTVHTNAYNHLKKTQVGKSFDADFTQWHNYMVDWEDSQMSFYVDGKQYLTFAPELNSKDKWPFDQPFYLILNIAVGGDWGGICVRNAPRCMFSEDQVMEVDFVRVSTLVPKLELLARS